MRTTTATAINMFTAEERTLVAVQNWLVVDRVKEEERSAGGIVLPGVDSGGGGEEAEVLAVGPEATSGVRVGDRIKFIGISPSFSVDGKKHYLVLDAKPTEMKNNDRGDPMGPPFLVCIIRRAEALQ